MHNVTIERTHFYSVNERTACEFPPISYDMKSSIEMTIKNSLMRTQSSNSIVFSSYCFFAHINKTARKDSGFPSLSFQ